MFCFSLFCADLLHRNCLLTGFNFSIKILLAKITSLFWILLCCLLSMLLFCIGSIYWCCFVVTSFSCSSHVPLFCGIPIVLPIFRCSWFYSMPWVTYFQNWINNNLYSKDIKVLSINKNEQKISTVVQK